MANRPQAKEHVRADGKHVRTGFCPTHAGLSTTAFLGVTAAGWVFQCRKGLETFANEAAAEVTAFAGRTREPTKGTGRGWWARP